MATLKCEIPLSLLGALTRAAAGNVSAAVTAALSQYLGTPVHTLFQVSTSGALVAGLYSGAVTVGMILQHGDLGLGTFENLDGEMVVLDGHVYQARANGTVTEAPAEARAPFAVVTRFTPEADIALPAKDSLGALSARCDSLRTSNKPVLRLPGSTASSITCMRAPCAPPAHAPAWSTPPRRKPSSISAKCPGTLVGLWSPGYSSMFSIPGYHFHFISEDRRHGGHLLTCATGPLRLRMERLSDFHLALPENESFLKADLSRNTAADLAYAEEAHYRKDLMSTASQGAPKIGADIVVRTLEAHGVKYVFRHPRGKIDSVFNALVDSTIETVVCRHEQNAAFIAGGIGRMTGKAGVALVTSGPGVSNLATGLATANSEGDPVVALGGAVGTAESLKQVHQTMDSVGVLKPITKFSANRRRAARRLRSHRERVSRRRVGPPRRGLRQPAGGRDDGRSAGQGDRAGGVRRPGRGRHDGGCGGRAG